MNRVDSSTNLPAPTPGGKRAAPEAEHLLVWYDRHRRRLPWRAEPGVAADPYKVWLSEIMLQQTTVKAVGPYFAAFLAAFPTVEALAAAPVEEVLRRWAGLGYYARARNLHACARAVVQQHGGRFPETEAGLRTLPGIGPYTAAAVAAIAFDQPAAAVDGNVERVIARLVALETPLPAAKPEIRALAERLVPLARAGDFAQALMDLGATICMPRQPACALCPWSEACAARAAGTQETFPRKAAKAARPLRRGAAFWLVRGGAEVLLRRRPQKGLLGGMAEVPGTAWQAEFDAAGALAEVPLAADWRRLAGMVRHGFTHFELELLVFAADVPASTPPPEGGWWQPVEDIDGAGLPTVMMKIARLAVAARDSNQDARSW
ncbi:A/G-specific adenine glycosylase [Blastochloris sulfoviridis]|uniref:Adenine DNA glycosylase n=1 Tax=Blastochloris sulfoviridis TaxID=50712 RepID=A0A5M6I4F7_9HYPH|nr:A/G-specific adenine glycosylase [Blastochloris sulfoviridis]